jgi:hypothetical protein
LARRQQLRRHAALVLVICATLGSVVWAAFGSAAAMPSAQAALACVAPEPAPLTSTQGDAPAASASPVASPLASPVARPVDNGPVSGEAEIEQLVRTIALCQTESRFKTLSRFVTEDFLGDVYAGGGDMTREQFAEIAPLLPKVPVAIVDVSNVEIGPDGTATAEVISTYGNQLQRAQWSFVFVPAESEDATGEEDVVGAWWPDGVTPLPAEPPSGADEVEIVLDDNTYDPDKLRVRGPDIVLSARNRGDEDHEMLVLSLEDDLTTDAILTAPGPALPKGVTVVGQLTVPAGSRGKLVLVDMEPGEYVIVDLLPTGDGTPHLSLGMEALLTVR